MGIRHPSCSYCTENPEKTLQCVPFSTNERLGRSENNQAALTTRGRVGQKSRISLFPS